MSVTTEGIASFKLLLQRLEEVPVEANKELKICAAELQTLAQEMAPVDEGNLEEAIKTRFESTRSSNGRFSGGSWVVYVDNEMPVPNRPGKTVGDYAWEMHEHLAPYGTMYQLGPLSVEKQAEHPEVIVGGKFLERATEEMRPIVAEKMGNVVRRHMG